MQVPTSDVSKSCFDITKHSLIKQLWTELHQHRIQRCKKLIEKKIICPVSSFWSRNDLNKHGFRIKTVDDHLIAGSHKCHPVLYGWHKKDINFDFSTRQSFNEEISHDNYINFKKGFLEMESIVILKVRISGFLSFVHTLSHYGLLTVVLENWLRMFCLNEISRH